MNPMSGLLSAISKAVPYVGIDKAERETERHEALLGENNLADDLGEGEMYKRATRQPEDASHLTGRSGSDLAQGKGAQVPKTTVLGRTTSHSSPPSRPTSCRSLSSSRVELDQQLKGSAISDQAAHRGIMTRPNNITSDRFARSGEYQHENGANNAVVWRVGDEDPKTSFRWRLSTRPSSDPDLRKTSAKSIKSLPNKPLKTCLKPKVKSANATPPNGSTTDIQSPLDNQKLRRMKTVDFEEAVSKPVPSRVRGSNRGFAYREEGQRFKHSKRTLSCPGTARLAKRSPAYPAVTRADVHVIAVAPATPRDFGDPSPTMGVEEADPATPTMQIVESSNGAYEIIWDDVPPEHNVRVRRRNSSASQALEAVNSTATRSLERVNTKLTEWSITWNAPSNSFKPRVVVFPDDDGCRPHFESAVVDEDIGIFAPPNSERASAAQSRHASRPVSASTSRAASQEHLETMKASPKMSSEESVTPVEHPLVDSDPDTWSAHLAAARRKIGEPGPARKLSNIDEADLKFRKHRDSVTIAQSRLIQSGRVRPELFAHKDSVTIAKKRMHAKNYASATSHHPHRDILQSEPDACTNEETSLPPLPLVKAHAVEALKNEKPASILYRVTPGSPRHIRIEE